eukprot:scaffold116057_cov63-Phaeocystis_antarctica.AAC.2
MAAMCTSRVTNEASPIVLIIDGLPGIRWLSDTMNAIEKHASICVGTRNDSGSSGSSRASAWPRPPDAIVVAH